MALHLLCVGGEDHALRIPFLTALRNRGLRVSAAGTGAVFPFAKNGIQYHRYEFDRFGAGFSDRTAMGQLSQLVNRVRPDVVQTFDTKPNQFAPLAIRGEIPVVRTINGMGWVFSSTDLKALAFRPVYLAMQRLAAAKTFRLPARTDLGEELPAWARDIEREMVPAVIDWGLVEREGSGWMSTWDQTIRGKGARAAEK